MLHFAPPAALGRPVQPASPPVTPDAYLVLRRKAAGLSVVELARRIDTGAQSESVALVRLLETPGMKARYRETIETFARALPIDVDVYLQLRDAPADRHPRVCRGCGCSEWDPCVSADGGHSCAWAGPASCTRCTAIPNVTVHQ